MVKTPSSMVELGTEAPQFSLPDTVSGEEISLSDLQFEKALLVMFICNHCPFVQHIFQELSQLGKDYHGDQCCIVAISSNDVVSYPEDGPEQMKQVAEQLGFTFPYLYDESQNVAKAYGATCTPDFFLFDGEKKLAYRGQLDDSRPGSGVPVTGRDLRAAIQSLLDGEAVAADQKPSLGCNIKWKA